MKLFKILMLCLVAAFTGYTAAAQANASINVLTQNSGQVSLGGTVYIQVDIGNTGPTSDIGVNKVRAQISIPIAIASAVPNGQQDGLPPGWTILTNTGGAITVCNGSDVILVNTVRTVLIKVQGNALGGPSTVTGVLSFGPGTGVCTGPGSLSGDITADNTSTSTIQVIPAPACNLSVSASAGTVLCNGGTTTLTATPSGASGSVEYSITGGAPFQAGNTFTVSAGTYTVTAREVSNPTCIATANAVTITQPSAISASASAGVIACNGGTTTLTVTASGGTAPLQYSLNGGTLQSGNTFTVGAGTYAVSVKDANNCTATTNSVTVTEPSAITASASAGVIACNGGTTTLTVTASGGTAPLQYSLNGGAFQSGNTFTVGAGTFTVTVRDANLCTATTNSVTVTEPTAITASLSALTTTICNGATTTLTVTASGGTAPLQYSLNGGTFQSGNTFTVGAGTYTVSVKDANNCTATTNSVTVTASSAITASASAGSAITCNGGTATLTVTASGGTAPLQYSLNGGAFQSGNTFTVGAGTYTVTVKDANNCTATTNSITVTQPTAVVANASAPPIGLPGGTTTITASATGGTSPYQFSLNGGAFQAGNTFIVSAGAYTITTRDANTCTASTTITLSDPTPGNANASINLLTLNSGQVNQGGVVDLQVSVGNTGPSFIGVNKVRAQISIPIAIAAALSNAGQTGLPPGWTILTNTGGTITICNGTDQIPANTVRNILIKIQGNTAGGPSTITGVLSFGPGTGVCTGPGSLPGDITADNTSTSTIQVISNCNLTASASAGTIACNGGTTTLTATPSGASGAVEYSITGGVPFQAGNTFTVSAGTYTVTVRETANQSCSATTNSVTVTEPSAITGSASAGTIACNGGTTTLTVTASGGTAPLQYSLNGGAFQSGNTFTVGAGTYTVSVKDANNCTATTNSVTVTEPTAISATASAGVIACNGGTTTLTVTASGGTAPLQYSLNGGAFQAGNTFTVAAGTYSVSVKDANLCTATTNSVTVTEPAAITGSLSALTNTICNGGTTTLTVTASGGTAPLQYSLNGGTFQSGNTFTVGAGTYAVSVKDANNCTATTNSVTVTASSAITASATAGPAITCNGGTTTLTVTASGGIAPLQYSLNGGAFQLDNTFTVGAGTYTVTVKDANNCTATTNIVTVTQPNAVVANASAPAIGLPGGTTTITASATGGTSPYQFSLNGGAFQSGNTFTVSAGTYTITARDANTCTGSTTITLSDPTPGNANASINLLTLNSGQVNQGSVVDLQVSVGNTGPSFIGVNKVRAQISIPIAIASALSNALQTGLPPGWTILTNTGGVITICNGTDQIPANTVRNILIKIQGNAAGGPSTITGVLSFGPGTGVCTGPGSLPGDITADNTSTSTIQVISNCNLTASASAGTIACNGETTTLTVTATGGAGTVEYSLNGGAFQAGNTFTVGAGTYTVTVRETANQSCSATTNSVTVTEPSAIIASASAGTIACNGGTTTLTVTASGGTAPLQYSLNGGGFQAGNTFTVGAGTYTVSVKDANNCTATTNSVTITTAADNINPTITAPTSVSVNTNEDCTATGVILGTPVTADNCIVASVTNNAPATFQLGATSVTWTVTDGSGNTATATQTVTVTDNVKPVVYFQGSSLIPGTTAASSSQTPYLLPTIPGVKITSLLSVNDAPGGYRMAGLADGLGAFDNNDGTFTVLMNHEITNTLGINRAHGAKGAFVSRWVINKSTLQVQGGSDLMQQVYLWNNTTQTSNETTSTFAFTRFCSGDLPAVSAYYNAATGLGTKARIYMHGEESGSTGYQMGTVASGPDAGKAYVLGKFNLSLNGSGLTGVGGWENVLANPFAQDKTVVIGNNDGGTGIMANSVAVYVGTKTNTGSEVDKAGLTNGTLKFVVVSGNPVEIVNSTTRTTNITSGTAFTLSGTASTTFSRPEDGAWDPNNPSKFYFVTTDQLDQVADGLGTQVGRSRLWRLNFTDITNPDLGGTIDLLLDGTEGGNMYDNLTIDKFGNVLLQEDPGNTDHNAKIWQYTIATDALTLIAKHDPARFGDRLGGVTTAATAPFNRDEESSGIIDVSSILGPGMFIFDDQAHYTPAANSTEVVEGGQLLLMFNPASIATTVSAAADTIRSCSGTGVNLGTPATADNCSVASLTNDAPATFPAGNTTVTWTVTDGSGNTAIATQVVIISSLAATATSTPVTTTGGTDGTATVTATGGTAPYTYLWSSGGQTTATAAGLAAGSYSVTVTDARGCTVTATTTVGSPACNLLVSATAGTIACNGGATTLTATVTGATGAVEYSLNGGAFQAGNTFTASAGTYIVTTREVSNPTCTATATAVTVTEPQVLVAASTVGIILCNGGVTTVTVTATGGTAPYTGTGAFTVSAGAYSYTVTDANGCTSVTSGTVSQPTVLVAASTTGAAILCNGGTTTVTVTATGGTAPYTGTGTFTVSAGAYSYTVTDANGCTSVTSGTITQPTAIAASASSTPVTTTGGSDGTATVTVAGSTAPYTYLWSPGGQTTTTATGLTAGNYTVTITDVNGCTTTTGTTVGTPACSILASASAGTIACFGGTTSLTVSVTGATGAIQYSLNGGAFQSDNTFIVPAGIYTVTVRDAILCTGTAAPVTVTQPSVLTVSSTATAIACNGGSSTVTVSATGGTAPYTGTGIFSETAGTYTYTVTDARGCTAVTTVTIAQPALLIASSTATAIACNGGSSTVTVSATGGTAPFTGTGTFTRTAGTYTFTVTDAKGCTAVTTVTITQPAVLAASSAAGTIACNGGSTTVTVSATGGTAPYTGTGTFIRTAGTYSFTVTDANGCTAVTTITITQPAVLAATATSTPATSGSNGTATATPTGGTAPYTYLWTPGGQTTQTATGLAAGTYTVTVTDSRGCTATATATVTSGCGVIANAGSDATLCPGGTVTLTGSATGGTTSGGTPPASPFTEVSGSTADKRIFSGNIDYIAIGNTFSQNEAGVSCLNGNCGQIASTSKTLTLPVGAIVKKAYLYWSGSGNLDNQVKLNGTSVTADGTKTYTQRRGYKYFAARKDVTSMVTASGTYTVSDLTWSNGSPYCLDNSAYGGWAMTIVYELASLPSARIHVNSEQFRFTYPANTYSTTINNISVPAGCSADGKLTFIAFEGDNYKDENLRINNVLDADPNNFRGQSGPNLDIITKNAPSIVGGTTSLTYSIQSYTQSYCGGSAIEGLFDYVKVLKYKNCPSGGCNNYTYTWKKNGVTVGTTQSITVNTPGTYVFSATDCANCTGTDETVVTASTLAATATTGPAISCYGGTTTVTVAATGGTAPYTGTGTFTKGAGTWSFTVTDAAGCSVVKTVTITQPSQLTATATAPQIPCGSTTTTVTVSASGGTSPYQYSLNGGAYQNANTFTVGNGSYTITVKDAKACTKQTTVTVSTASCGPVDPNKCYKLIARHSGKAATVANSSTSNGGNVEQRSYSGGNNQVWKFVQVQTGYYEIINVNSGKVLDVNGGSTANGANIQQWTYGGGDNQKWSLTANGSYFVIKAKHSGKAMSVENSSTSNGANVEQRGNGNDYNQQWSIVEVSCPGYNTRGKEKEIEEENIQTELSVTVSPNPSISYFNLTVKSDDNNTPVSVRILDANGKVMSVHPNVAVNNTLRIGSEKWTGGMYFAEVTQGDKRKVVKLIRAN